MTEERITELWNASVCATGSGLYPEIITRFAELIAADVREACAKVCEDLEVHDVGHPGTAFAVQGMCINAIRSRNNKGAE